jgi:hypothetical protein
MFSHVELDLAENAKSVMLVENTGNSEAASIYLEYQRSCWVELCGDWCFGKCSHELPKCDFCRSSPLSMAAQCVRKPVIGVFTSEYPQINRQ